MRSDVLEPERRDEDVPGFENDESKRRLVEVSLESDEDLETREQEGQFMRERERERGDRTRRRDSPAEKKSPSSPRFPS